MHPQGEPQGHLVTGRVAAGGRAAVGLFVEVVGRGVGTDVRLGQATTDPRGHFAVGLAGTGTAPDLQARVWSREGGALLGESRVAFAAGPLPRLDVDLPADTAGLTSEYEALIGATAAAFTGRLADVEESAVRRDVSYLAAKVGWDARAVAMAALAERFADTEPAIPAALFYALFRAGLPADPELLFLAGSPTVDTVWQDALARGVVPADLAAELPRARAAFVDRAAGSALAHRAVPGTSTLAELLARGLGNDADAQDRFARLRDEHGADPSAFWSGVTEAFGADTARALHVDAQLAALTLNNAPLVAAVHRAESTSAPAAGSALTGTPDLARRGWFRPERWLDLIGDTIPDRVPGASPEERRQRYAELMAAQVQVSAPTAVVAARIGDGELLGDVAPDVRADVVTFLDDHRGRFEIGVEPVERFVARHDDVSAPAEPSLAQLKRVQRVYQVTPDDQALGVLLDAGVDSALAVARQAPAAFVAAHAESLGTGTAAAVHARSQQIADSVTAIANSFLTSRLAPVLGSRPEAPILGRTAGADAPPAGVIPAFPTLEGLFGSLDVEACEECESVTSPAAYLVDLLMFVDDEDAAVNPLKVLTERRPDLEHIALTCANTTTELPYLDLVTEILEHLVVHGSPAGFTGHDTAEDAVSTELLADPQFVDDAAYRILAEEFHPAPLPFHHPLELLRRLFGALRVPLPRVMRTLRRDEAVDTPANRYGWRDVLMEELGLSRAEHRLLTGDGVTLAQACGYPTGTTDAAAAADLAGAAAFATRTGAGFAELVALLGTRFVAPAAGTTLQLGGGNVTTPFGQLKLQRVAANGSTSAPSVADLTRLVRFVRLWRRLGWTVEETDFALTALYPGAADDPPATLDANLRVTLARLGTAVSVLRRLHPATGDDAPGPGRDLAPLLACWAPIDGRGPLYRELFLSGGRVDPAFAPNPAGAVLTDPNARLLAHADTLRGALRLTAEQFAAIAADLGATDQTGLTLAQVSAVHRRAWLARALDVDVADLLALAARTGIDPFAAPEPPAPGLVTLLDLVEDLRAAGTDAWTVLRILWTQAPVDESAVADLGTALRAALAGVAADLAVDEGASADRVAALLTRVVDTDTAAALAALLDGAWNVTVPWTHPGGTLSAEIVAAGRSRLTYDAGAKLLSFAGPLDQTTRDAVVIAAPGVAGFAAAVDALVAAAANRGNRDLAFAAAGGQLDALVTDQQALLRPFAASPAPPAVKRAELLRTALAAEQDRLRRDAALAAFAAAAGTDPATVALLLDDPAVLRAADGTSSALAGLLALDAADLATAPELRAAWVRLRAALALASALGLGGAEIAHVAARPGHHLEAVPVEPPAPGALVGPTELLRDALRLVRLKGAFGGNELLAALRAPTPTADSDPVLALTGWRADSLRQVLTHLGKGRADLADLAVFVRVQRVFALLDTFGIGAASLLAATTNDPDAAAVRTLQATLRAQRDPDTWLNVVKSVNDPVRALRRDALVAHVLKTLAANPDTAAVDTPERLFEYLMMDVQMGACMGTSRIRNAISAVQLFVDRVLMNLEPRVPPSTLNRAHWEWMKRYRLWQANREVFLWPENWLDPELRGDRSAFFQQVTSELLQSDITDDTAATALLGYLSSLEEVARLEPCAIHVVEQEPGAEDDVVYVVARTAGAQRRYFLRRREYGSWTPWEPIPLDIEDNPVMPVRWKGRLLLFWLKIVNAGQPMQPSPTPDGTTLSDITFGQFRSEGARNVKLVPQAVLCWSEYYNGGWQPQKTSNVAAPTGFGRTFDSTGEGAFARDRLVLQETTEGDALRLRITGQGTGTSFLLFNTHSLPERQEDRRALPPGLEDFAQAVRDISVVDGTLRLDYRAVSPASRSLIRRTDEGPVRITQPFPVAYVEGELQESFVRHPWEAPFFYADARHVFYVETEVPRDTTPDAPPGVGGTGAPFGLPAPPAAPPVIPPVLGAAQPLAEGEPLRAVLATPAPLRFGTEDIDAAGGRAPAAPGRRPGTEGTGSDA